MMPFFIGIILILISIFLIYTAYRIGYKYGLKDMGVEANRQIDIIEKKVTDELKRLSEGVDSKLL